MERRSLDFIIYAFKNLQPLWKATIITKRQNGKMTRL
jgi:hypothetical protein